MSAAADSAVAFDLFSQEVERLRKVAAVPPSPVRFDAGDTLVRRLSRADEDEEEPPRNMRRRSRPPQQGSTFSSSAAAQMLDWQLFRGARSNTEIVVTYFYLN